MRDWKFLDRLQRKPGDSAVFRAADFQAMVDAFYRARVLDARFNITDTRAFKHPWDITTQEADGIENGWRIDIQPGWINDLFPTILYLRKDDPRGWTPPPGYVESPLKTDRLWSPTWIERDLLDDLDDPPWLLAVGPLRAAKKSPDFTLLKPQDWHPYFKPLADTDLKDAEVWTSHVILTSSQFVFNSGTPGVKAPVSQQKYRLWIQTALPTSDLAQQGGWVELARLHLVRYPDDSRELYVQQLEFWCLWSALLNPAAQVESLASGGGDIENIVASGLAQILAGTEFIDFWTV